MKQPEYFATVADLHESITNRFCDLVHHCVQDRGVFRVSLSGGSTPKRLYELLAKRNLPWSQMHFYWGDERNVPAEHEDSNQRMVRQAMLGPANVGEDQIHPVPVLVDDPAAAALDYEQLLRIHFKDDALPPWDLALLGMGDDAHTASLFPGTTATQDSVSGETTRWFVENFVDKFDAYRYTLTAAAINSARNKWFLISGENKRTALSQLFAPQGDPLEAPVRLIDGAEYFITEDARP